MYRGCPAGTHTCASDAHGSVASVAERQLVRASCCVGGVVKWTCGVLKRCLSTSVSQHVSSDFFVHSNFAVSDLQKGSLKPRKRIEIWLPHQDSDHPDLPKGPIPTEKGAKREAIPSFERRKGPRASWPPCIHFSSFFFFLLFFLRF